MKSSKIIYLILLLFFNSMLTAQDLSVLRPLDAELTQVKYPFPVHFKMVKNQGQELKMAYMDVKPEKPNGKTIVLLHGKNFNGYYFEQTARTLQKEGFRVIMPDQIGFGKSSKPRQYQFSFQQLAENTKSVLDGLNIDRFIILGHSMGGMLATKMAVMYPENTEKLILANPIGLEDYRKFSPYQNIDKQYAAELKNTHDSYKNYQLQYYYDGKWKPEYDRWLNLLAGWTISKDFPVTAWNAALTSDMIYTQPVVDDFEKISVPTLLIIGTRDRTAIGKAYAPKSLQPKMGMYQNLGKETQQKIKNSKLVELENIGHSPHIEAFDRFIVPLLQFIQ
ncbi:alpha/beta fold hydrolase [Chryseobacterium sp. MFBS3-17]|uniref:alpha/beta fold hydrolase n=1 Tax=Chryseobacterium sp. MFBS3-17 TaxID=2886689 RepID=UPI001D0EEE23|nr:alpha/beta hydrolase [Chryseobacterium sp. MFBS3-17]MCC2590108.1 alpha/beta hydrolase [Chryseobacterium sp. MFBS3-17]